MSRTVVITGATRGLGFALASRFLKSGDRVYGVSRTRKHWKKALADFPGAGKISLHQVDLTDEGQVRRFARSVQKQSPKPDILINNAGYGGGLAAVQKTTLREYEKLLRDNLTSAFLMCKHFLPVFQAQDRGYIVNISSMAGKRAVPRLFGYSAAKFGVIALSQAIAKENEKSGFKCFTVCPGGINTEMRAAIFGKEDAQRQQSPDFVAGIVMDLLEERTPLVSGSDVVIRHGKVWGINPPPGA